VAQEQEWRPLLPQCQASLSSTTVRGVVARPDGPVRSAFVLTVVSALARTGGWPFVGSRVFHTCFEGFAILKRTGAVAQERDDADEGDRCSSGARGGRRRCESRGRVLRLGIGLGGGWVNAGGGEARLV
jgi:hypothetical protein